MLGLIKLNEEYVNTLTGLKKVAISKSQLEEANRIEERIKAVKAEIISFSDEYTNRDAKDAIIETRSKFSPFTVGALVFSNRKYQWTEVPSDFDGYRVSIAQGGAKKRDFTFSVTKAGIVRVVACGKDADQLLEDGWKESGEAARTPNDRETVHVLEKVMHEGDYTLTGQDFLGIRLLLPAE